MSILILFSIFFVLWAITFFIALTNSLDDPTHPGIILLQCAGFSIFLMIFFFCLYNIFDYVFLKP